MYTTEDVSEALPCGAKGVSWDISTGTTECGRGGSVWWSKRESRLARAEGEGGARGGRNVFIHRDGRVCEWVTGDETDDVEAIGGAGVAAERVGARDGGE